MKKFFYDGIPIDKVDFEKEFEEELEQLTDNIKKLKAKKYAGKKMDYRYWAIKLKNANIALEVGSVTLNQYIKKDQVYDNLR